MVKHNDKATRNPSLRDYFKENPDVAAMWGTKNSDEDLDKTTGSTYKAWWICDKFDFEYRKPIYSKISRPQSCSVCNGNTVFTGVNDLVTVCPSIASEWDYEKNDTSPNKVKYSSGKPAWWICSCGYRWKTRISHRTSAGSGCPKCNPGRIQIKECISDNEFMLSMFLSSSDGRDCNEISVLSPDPVSWRCECGYAWKCAPRHFKGCPLCLGKVTPEGNKTYILTRSVADIPIMNSMFDKENNIMSPHHVPYSSSRKAHWICPSGHIWHSYVYQVYGSVSKGFTGCPYCSHSVSSPEDSIFDFLSSIVYCDIERNSRHVIPPYEVDFYIPEKSIAIEFNGLYWHSEKRVPSKEYHFNKWKMCADKGIQLITIWEDDWRDKRSTVEFMLSTELDSPTLDKVHVDETFISTIKASCARTFLDKYYIQSFMQGSVYYALMHKDDIVAVSVWCESQDEFILSGYAESVHIVGGLEKLLDAGIHYAQQLGYNRIVTFTDNCTSSSSLYKSLGFIEEDILPPDYSYLMNKRRVHKDDHMVCERSGTLTVTHGDSIKKEQLEKIEVLDKIYDCGRTRMYVSVMQ